jgi:hypothetical protein
MPIASQTASLTRQFFSTALAMAGCHASTRFLLKVTGGAARRLLPRQLHENVEVAYAVEQAGNERVGHGELRSFGHRVTEMSCRHAVRP